MSIKFFFSFVMHFMEQYQVLFFAKTPISIKVAFYRPQKCYLQHHPISFLKLWQQKSLQLIFATTKTFKYVWNQVFW